MTSSSLLSLSSSSSSCTHDVVYEGLCALCGLEVTPSTSTSASSSPLSLSSSPLPLPPPPLSPPLSLSFSRPLDSFPLSFVEEDVFDFSFSSFPSFPPPPLSLPPLPPLDSSASHQPLVVSSRTLHLSSSLFSKQVLSHSRALLKQRKLLLVLDLDHTLLHTTDDVGVAGAVPFLTGEKKDEEEDKSGQKQQQEEVKEEMGEGKEGADEGASTNENVEILFFALPFPPLHPLHQTNAKASGTKAATQSHFVRLRPYTRLFLQSLVHLFDLHVYTMGSRPYAEKIVDWIDPTSMLFRQRVVTRTETKDLSFKYLQRMYACDLNLCGIVDDRLDVWGEHKGNVLRVWEFSYWATREFYQRNAEQCQENQTVKLHRNHQHKQLPELRTSAKEQPQQRKLKRDQTNKQQQALVQHQELLLMEQEPAGYLKSPEIDISDKCNLDATSSSPTKKQKRELGETGSSSSENESSALHSLVELDSLPQEPVDRNVLPSHSPLLSTSATESTRLPPLVKARSGTRKIPKKVRLSDDLDFVLLEKDVFSSTNALSNPNIDEEKKEAPFSHGSASPSCSSPPSISPSSDISSASASQTPLPSGSTAVLGSPSNEAASGSSSQVKHENHLVLNPFSVLMPSQRDPARGDNVLLSLLSVLQASHSLFYAQFPSGTDTLKLPLPPALSLPNIFARLQTSVLRGCHVVFSGFVANHIKMRDHDLGRLAMQFGACVYEDMTSNGLAKDTHETNPARVTHVIAWRDGSQKVVWAQNLQAAHDKGRLNYPSPHVVCLSWLYFSTSHYQKADEAHHSLSIVKIACPNDKHRSVVDARFVHHADAVVSAEQLIAQAQIDVATWETGNISPDFSPSQNMVSDSSDNILLHQQHIDLEFDLEFERQLDNALAIVEGNPGHAVAIAATSTIKRKKSKSVTTDYESQKKVRLT